MKACPLYGLADRNDGAARFCGTYFCGCLVAADDDGLAKRASSIATFG